MFEITILVIVVSAFLTLYRMVRVPLFMIDATANIIGTKTVVVIVLAGFVFASPSFCRYCTGLRSDKFYFGAGILKNMSRKAVWIDSIRKGCRAMDVKIFSLFYANAGQLLNNSCLYWCGEIS